MLNFNNLFLKTNIFSVKLLAICLLLFICYETQSQVNTVRCGGGLRRIQFADGSQTECKYDRVWWYSYNPQTNSISYLHGNSTREVSGNHIIATVRSNGLWGVIDTSGNYIIKPSLGREPTAEMIKDAVKKEEQEKIARLERTALLSAEQERARLTVNHYITSRMRNWEEQGEFERTADWQLRTSFENRVSKEDELLEEAGVWLIQEANRLLIGAQVLIIGRYNVDREAFPLSSELGEWLLHVPIAEAPEFRERYVNWNVTTASIVVEDKGLSLLGKKITAVRGVQVTSGQGGTGGQATSVAGGQAAGVAGGQATSVTGGQANQSYNVTSTVQTNQSKNSNNAGDFAIGFHARLFPKHEDVAPSAGIGAKMQIFLANNFRSDFSFTYFIPKEFDLMGFSVRSKMWHLDLNTHGLFVASNVANMYAMAGIAITGIGVEDVGSSESESEAFFGLNLGGGLELKLGNNFSLNVEPKWRIIDISGDTYLRGSFYISAGFLIRF
jgi:opacity protein-like surface antigen